MKKLILIIKYTINVFICLFAFLLMFNLFFMWHALGVVGRGPNGEGYIILLSQFNFALALIFRNGILPKKKLFPYNFNSMTAFFISMLLIMYMAPIGLCILLAVLVTLIFAYHILRLDLKNDLRIRERQNINYTFNEFIVGMLFFIALLGINMNLYHKIAKIYGYYPYAYGMSTGPNNASYFKAGEVLGSYYKDWDDNIWKKREFMTKKITKLSPCNPHPSGLK